MPTAYTGPILPVKSSTAKPYNGPILPHGEMPAAPAAPPKVPFLGVPEIEDMPPITATRLPRSQTDLNPLMGQAAENVPDTGTGEDMLGRFVMDSLAKNPHALDLALQSGGRAVADTIGAIPDLAGLVYNAAVVPTVNNIGRGFGAKSDLLDPAPSVSDMIANASSDLAAKIGIETKNPEDMSGPERLGYEATRFGGSAGLAGAGLARTAASRGAAYGPRIARKPMFGDSVLEPYETNAPAAIADDIAAGAGAGAVHAGLESNDIDNPLADFAGMMVGGLGGVSTKRALAGGAGGVADMVRGARTAKDVPRIEIDGRAYDVSNRDADRAAKAVQDGMSARTPEARQKVADDTINNANYFRDNNLPVPPTGALSEDIGMIMSENRARASGGEMSRKFTEKDAELHDAAAKQIRGVRPDVTESEMRAPQQRAEQERELANMAADAAVGAKQTARDAAATNLEKAQRQGPEIVGPYRSTEAAADMNAASRQLDKSLKGDLDAKTASKNAKYDAAAAAGGERDASSLIGAAQKVRERFNALSNQGISAPEGFIQRLEKMAATEKDVPGEPGVFKVDPMGVSEQVSGRAASKQTVGGKVSVEDLNKTRRDVAMLEKKARQRGDYETADNLRAFKSAIDGEFDTMIAKGEPGGAEMQEARRAYQEDYAPYYGTGAGKTYRDDVQTDDIGRTKTPAEGTAARFMGTSADQASASADLRRILNAAENPEAGKAAVRSYVVSSLARTLGSDGQPSVNALQRWRSDWSGTLKSHPEVAAEVDTLIANVKNNRVSQDKLAAELKDFDVQLKGTEKSAAASKKRAENSSLSVFIGRDPDKAAARILNDEDSTVIDDINRRLEGNESAKRGLKAAMTDHLIKTVSTSKMAVPGGEDAVVSARAYRKLFNEKRGVLSKVYSPDEMNAMQRTGKLLEAMDNKGRAASAGSQTAERTNDRMIEAGLKAYFGILKGGGVFRTFKLWRDLASDDEAVQVLLGNMQFNPELASHLMTRDTSRVGTPKWNRRLTEILSGIEQVREYDRPEDNETE